jgi:hypothetical protein
MLGVSPVVTRLLAALASTLRCAACRASAPLLVNVMRLRCAQASVDGGGFCARGGLVCIQMYTCCKQIVGTFRAELAVPTVVAGRFPVYSMCRLCG